MEYRVGDYTFNYNEKSHSPIVDVSIKGKRWGSPQGDRFLLALIKENMKLRQTIQDNGIVLDTGNVYDELKKED